MKCPACDFPTWGNWCPMCWVVGKVSHDPAVIMSEPCLIKLTKGFYAVVDEQDYDSLVRHSWHVTRNKRIYYARRNVIVAGIRKTLLMHVAIMGEPPEPGTKVDHIDHDGLKNRRKNLRWSTGSQNNGNQRKTRGTSIYKGVCWHKGRKKWHARVEVYGKNKHLGYFSDEETAARAYDAAAVRDFGEFALPNFPTKENACDER